jgi:hypothetical protein
MIEYQNLQLESKNHYKTIKFTTILANLLNKYHRANKLAYINLIKTNIKNTTNPIEFIRKIENNLKKIRLI